MPMKLIKRHGDTGIVEYNGIKYNAVLKLLDSAKIGDYLIIHAGFAIQKMNEREAKDILAIYEEMSRLARNQ